MTQFPIEAQELEYYLPHRSPMRWIDRIIEIPEWGHGTTETDLIEGSLFLKNKQINSMALIELLAQSYGYLKAIEIRSHSATQDRFIAVASLAAVDHFQMFTTNLPVVGGTLQSEVTTVNSIHPIYVVEGWVRHKNQLLCHAQLKCFALLNGETWESL
jgi:hypothetical protein